MYRIAVLGGYMPLFDKDIDISLSNERVNIFSLIKDKFIIDVYDTISSGTISIPNIDIYDKRDFISNIDKGLVPDLVITMNNSYVNIPGREYRYEKDIDFNNWSYSLRESKILHIFLDDRNMLECPPDERFLELIDTKITYLSQARNTDYFRQRLQGKYLFKNIDFKPFIVSQNILASDEKYPKRQKKDIGFFYAGMRDRVQELGNIIPQEDVIDLPNLIIGQKNISQINSKCKFDFKDRVSNKEIVGYNARALATIYMSEQSYIDSLMVNLRLFEALAAGTVPLFHKNDEPILKEYMKLSDKMYEFLIISNHQDLSSRLVYLNNLTTIEYNLLIDELFGSIEFNKEQYINQFIDICKNTIEGQK